MIGDGEVWITGFCRDKSCKQSDIKIGTIQDTKNLNTLFGYFVLDQTFMDNLRMARNALVLPRLWKLRHHLQLYGQ